jgi:serine/threonine protein kinase/Leucine-rich repeat (LRR) protein
MEDAANPIEALFAQAMLQRDPDRRAAFLDRACAGDARLRERIEALLKAHGEAGSFMADGSGKVAAETLDNAAGVIAPGGRRPHKGSLIEKPGTLIGRYKLLQQIGEGGFGVVYMAEQEVPVKRRVALKVIKAGMDTKAVIARFEAERQALAMMDHPNIARVLDAGATESGRPYFVMELVKGIPITDYCDQAHLDMHGRLELFIDVCHAVQHAHQKGVIHRDLKPSNIMVTLRDDKPNVKVIDFGIAKATEQKLTEKTLFTNYGQMIGTPVYMSPEQAVLSEFDVDTRSDIYSLGVLLYELLTGSPPFDAQTLRNAGFDEMRRIIREQTPQKPSTRLSTLAEDVKMTVAGKRQVSPQALSKQLHGDLDWIILKAIEKDRTRRYDTANGLAADLKRHIENEPVLARPPSAAYRFQKAFQRNRLVFAAAGAIAAVLVIGIAVSAWQAVRAKYEAIRATSAEQKATAALDELRATAPAFAEQARGMAAKERFDEAIEKLDYAIKLRPDKAEYLVAKADLLQCQLRLSDAAVVYRQALATQPGLERAQTSAKLCEELLAASKTEQGKLSRESLAKLSLAMQEQQRPAAELMPVARLLGEEKKLVLAYWLARFKDFPISGERPLEKRLTMRNDGRLALDLSETKVTDLTPLAGAPLASLDLSGNNVVQDLSPLHDLHTLESLNLYHTRISDISALGGLRLKQLKLTGCPVSDLSPLIGAPIEEIDLRDSRVADLSPLADMPIKSIDLTAAPVVNFAPLAKMPLEKCYFQRNRIGDLAILRGKPLKELVIWGCIEARNYAVLKDIKTLELLLLPSEYRDLPSEEIAAIESLRNHPRLRQLGSEIMNGMGYAATSAKDVFWQDWDREQSFVPALRKRVNKFEIIKLINGTYSLRMYGQNLGDLGFLKDAPISELDVAQCQITDLEPIRSLRLTMLNVSLNPVTDLTPLREMPLESLYLTGTEVKDISPLAKLPLKVIAMDSSSGIDDVSVLGEIPTLEKVTLPMGARKIEMLRKLPKLVKLSYYRNPESLWEPTTSVGQFWKAWDDQPWGRALEAARIKYYSEQDAKGMWTVTIASPDFSDTSLLKGARIKVLNLNDTAVTDLKPLAGLPLTELALDRTPVSDISPLGGLALKGLSLRDTQVTDLSVLREKPLCSSLEGIWLYRTKVADFSPVAACKSLQIFDASGTSMPDLEPLRGCQLRSLYIASTGVSDLSVLEGMPLHEIFFDQIKPVDVTPLLKSPTLKRIILSENVKHLELLRKLPHVERISFKFNPDITAPSTTVAEFWKNYDESEWVRTLESANKKRKAMTRLEDGTWEVNLSQTSTSDITMLAGKPISRLWLGSTTVSDLGPVKGMPLRFLWLYDSKVSDLTPLKGLKLVLLNLANTDVKDLSPVRGMPFTSLRLHGCKYLTDFSPLADARELTEITLPAGAKGIEFLRTFPKLKRISFTEDASNGFRPDKTAAEFWEEYDAQKTK